ncbi:phage holin family protein [Streptoalloteichus hindustanus]|uniref:Putative Holin-X, holin superfamily III n=1 Tax=Streptoalloteichus hindustanus TaxID=2017 RepID=A0A1M4VTD0_STRHI|nr:phage holin family protein [Streptoalloteichus hindustanus]SHE72381.1 Putative Holin-X, holin superfamily III [Streptoalloteichus hindustanus]
MTDVTSGQYPHNGSRADGGLPPVPSIPLTEERVGDAPGDQSLGSLVRDATAHLSTLVRSEVELAKMEIAAEVKKGVRGSVYFILALAVLVFASFFLFFAVAELLADLGLYRSASFGIVFAVMLATAGFLGFLGYRRVRSIRKPERTISTVRETAERLSSLGDQHAAEAERRPSAPTA